MNALDLSPNFSGTIMALANGIGVISGMAAPAVVGILAPNVSIVRLPNRWSNHVNWVHLFCKRSIYFFENAAKFCVLTCISIQQTLSEWRFVFWFTFFILSGTFLIFLFLFSEEIQPWNYGVDDEE